MANDTTTARSRRALLAAAAGGAAALAATAAMPLTALAADGDDVVLGVANTEESTTSISNSTEGSTGFAVNATGAAAALLGTSTGAAGVYAVSVDGTDAALIENTSYTGVYGWSPSTPPESEFAAAGVVGQSPDIGLYGDGYYGSVGWGFYGAAGFGHVGLLGEALDPGGYGVHAVGDTTTNFGLRVDGRIRLTNRAGRATIGAGRSSVVVNVSGATTVSRVYAVLNSNRSGRYVRAVVPSAGKITIYLNSTVSAASTVSWLLLD
ncbi:MAG TPA: hypothetical protein VLA44_03525 [Clostridia bacterium]|nr:hypothetical protein [Clostridia bacterium]